MSDDMEKEYILFWDLPFKQSLSSYLLIKILLKVLTFLL